MKKEKEKNKTLEDRPTTQTVKLERPLFLRLKIFAAKTRRTGQDIMSTALDEYLKKMKG